MYRSDPLFPATAIPHPWLLENEIGNIKTVRRALKVERSAREEFCFRSIGLVV